MDPMKMFVIHLKKNIVSFLFVFLAIGLILFSKSTIEATKNALQIWINAIIPSLLPFFMATELLGHTQVPQVTGKLFGKLMRPIFNVPSIGAYALLMGMVSGYPIGAKIVTHFRNQQLCTKEEAERLLTFTNNSGPLFILGTVGISLFCDKGIGILLLITHITASLSVGFLFRFWKKKSHQKRNIEDSISSSVSFPSLGEILSLSIFSAIRSVVMIGGFVVLFAIILSILQRTSILYLLYALCLPVFHFGNLNPSFIIPLLTGLLELTNGISAIASIPSKNLGVNVIFSAFLLGFGGISILLQVSSILSKTDISIKPYLFGKLLHGILAATYTYGILHFCSYYQYLQI